MFRTRTDAKRTLREITILRQCHHANIVKLKWRRRSRFRSRHILLPRDEEVYKQLWIVQVAFWTACSPIGVWRLGLVQGAEELEAHHGVVRQAREEHRLPDALWLIIPPGAISGAR